ncbi:MAG: 16S rRNA (cytosine(967)-C(5))-methyltransferase RsmB [Desulfuromonas sp.]|nr:16S rRNA (cytosine(967)-C(5))-methyltransferase RsmB [Desulfuromonas sp.]
MGIVTPSVNVLNSDSESCFLGWTVAKNKKLQLSDARGIAFTVLCRVDEGAYSDLALDAELNAVPDLDSRERGLATELVYGVLRRQGNLDYALRSYCRQSLEKLEPPVRCLLRLGFYQLLYLDRIPPRAVVHSMVELARRTGLERVTGLINGILRSGLREPERVVWPQAEQDPLGWLQHQLSLPEWLARRWQKQYGDIEAGALAETLLSPAPVTLRVNTLKIDRPTFMQYLAEAGIEARITRYAPEGVVLPEAGSLLALPGREEGWYQVQDEASMLIAHLLRPQAGDRILDVCAAPGGKTTHMAALTANGAEIVALDLHPKRLQLLTEGARRLGCEKISVQPWDMSRPCDVFTPGSFQRVLVDAPCTGLGVLRRNPETRWRRTEQDIKRLAVEQQKILGNAVLLVAPGGLLIYSLCTTTDEESCQVVAKFLATHPQFETYDLRQHQPDSWQELFDDEGHLLTLTSRHGGMDCFYAAGFRRKSD